MGDPRGSSGNNAFLLVCGWLEKCSSLEELRAPLAEAKARLPGYERRLGEPFALTVELEAKTTELKAFEADLAANDSRDRNDQMLTAGGQPEKRPLQLAARPPTHYLFPCCPMEEAMPDQNLPAAPRPAWASFEAVEEAAQAARAHRVASGEVMTYMADGWIVREYPDGHIERLAPIAEFRDEDFPYPA
ncbi:protein of unknown function (plasmid) [Rhodovastum atsumiense]|nr:hypothetical protein [Rhodovastum atsumiense]CAH2605933.1 protein of unknown function [Rhodovastum atsumiense]